MLFLRKKNWKYSQTLVNLIALHLLFLALPALSDQKSSADKGLAIAKEVERRDQGWGDSASELEMELTNKQGHSSSRKMSIKTMEVDGDGDKSLTVFHEPRDVKGTAFLSFSHSLEPDQQWLFLPALKRVKRIASANKSGPFLGSEFAFEDISSFEVDKYAYEYLRDESLNGLDCFVVKYTPKYEHSGYSFQEVWIDKSEYRIQKIDYYDRKESLLKTQQFLGYKKYLDKYWRASEFLVNNHQTGKSTKLTWQNYEFNQGLSDSDFNKNTLKRAR